MEWTKQVPQPLRRRLSLPAYTVAEAALLVSTAPLTVSRWFYGYSTVGRRQRPVIGPTRARRQPLSYLHLVEVAFVASFRKYGVSLQRIRKAHEYLRKMFHTDYPFALLRLKTEGIHILKDLEVSENGGKPALIVADANGQEAWPELIADRFEQFEYEYDIAIRWYPRGKCKPIVIDPRVAFGAPIIVSVGVATWALKERYESGESLDELKEDFGIDQNDLQAALEFEGVIAKRS